MHDLIHHKHGEIADLCRRFEVQKLVVFGSAARGDDFDPLRSDADFLVEFDPKSELSPLQQFFGFRDALASLLGYSVDLIEMNAIRNPYVLEDIERSREVVYAAQVARLPWDALQACEAISRFVDGMTLAMYLDSDVIRSAVERKFEIIGEGLNQFSRVDPEAANQVPNLREIVAFRNLLIHGYAAIENRRVWRIIEDLLPDLRAVLADLIEGNDKV